MSYKIKIPGIYIITCLSNNKHYIGRSVDCKERLSKHKSLLKEGTQYSYAKFFQKI